MSKSRLTMKNKKFPDGGGGTGKFFNRFYFLQNNLCFCQSSF
jgi:hypothetical protein